MSVSRDFEELFACFNAREVKALVVGAYAVAFHAKPRFTKDLDVWVEATEENARRLLQALEDFGFGGLGLVPGDFTVTGRIVQLGYPPNRIDLLTSLAGLEFAAAWDARVEGLYGDQPVSYLGRADLVRNKQTVGRAQDRVDLAALGAADDLDSRKE